MKAAWIFMAALQCRTPPVDITARGQRKSDAEFTFDVGRLRGGLYRWLPVDIQGARIAAHAIDVDDQCHLGRHHTGSRDSVFISDDRL